MAQMKYFKLLEWNYCLFTRWRLILLPHAPRGATNTFTNIGIHNKNKCQKEKGIIKENQT